MAKAALNKKALSSINLDFNVMKKLVKCYTGSIVLYGAETWTLWEVNQQHPENFEIWCWRRTAISWNSFVKYETYYNVAHMGEERGVYRVLLGKPEGRRPLGRPKCRWVDNIRMDHQEVGCGYMDWIGLAQDRDKWRTLVSAVMNLWVL